MELWCAFVLELLSLSLVCVCVRVFVSQKKRKKKKERVIVPYYLRKRVMCSITCPTFP